MCEGRDESECVYGRGDSRGWGDDSGAGGGDFGRRGNECVGN